MSTYSRLRFLRAEMFFETAQIFRRVQIGPHDLRPSGRGDDRPELGMFKQHLHRPAVVRQLARDERTSGLAKGTGKWLDLKCLFYLSLAKYAQQMLGVAQLVYRPRNLIAANGRHVYRGDNDELSLGIFDGGLHAAQWALPGNSIAYHSAEGTRAGREIGARCDDQHCRPTPANSIEQVVEYRLTVNGQRCLGHPHARSSPARENR